LTLYERNHRLTTGIRKKKQTAVRTLLDDPLSLLTVMVLFFSKKTYKPHHYLSMKALSASLVKENPPS
jgi:hypothetical protein